MIPARSLSSQGNPAATHAHQIMSNTSSSSIAVFVMSCDRTSDVARHFVAAFAKYWPDCPYPIYFGINQNQRHLASLGAVPLPSEVKGWREETIAQLQVLRTLSPVTTHVLIFLDDFILGERVDTGKIRSVLAEAAAADMAYLRIRRLEEGVVGELTQLLLHRRLLGEEPCIRIRPDHPYLSSLQVALWRLDHLRRLVEQCDDMWALERFRDAGDPHYSTLRSLIEYRHIVEKGEWDVWAEAHCRRAIGWFEPNSRPMRTANLTSLFISHIRRLGFRGFGYLPMRLKKRIFGPR